MARLIFLGPPGAGKGTQAQTLSKILEIPHISTGEILRNSVANNTHLGQKAKSYMDAGELVPDHLILELIRERLAEPDTDRGWLLDGFPRNVSQATFLEKLLEEVGQAYDNTINLEVPDEILVVRLLSRGRQDDNEDVIRRRLVVYREQTEPLINFYRERQLLISIDGNRPPDDVTSHLRKVLEN
ncbi:MAG: adenylate kinase [Leptolyngbyaceae cyanobacterium bins.59]|nr:adenylate kinase [Leptolyngbyaceae cyanobacterium bins.59]